MSSGPIAGFDRPPSDSPWNVSKMAAVLVLGRWCAVWLVLGRWCVVWLALGLVIYVYLIPPILLSLLPNAADLSMYGI